MANEIDIWTLIGRCAADDPEAWEELRELIDADVRSVIEREVTSRRVHDKSVADEIRQDFYLDLQRCFVRHVAGFQGKCVGSFVAYLRTTAQNLTRNELKRRARLERREAEAHRVLARPDLVGPAEDDFDAGFQDLLSAMPPKLRPWMNAQLVNGEELDELDGDAPVSKRTRQRRLKVLRNWCETWLFGDWPPRDSEESGPEPDFS